MTLIVLDEAEKEFADAVDYYDGRLEGLGARFRDEADALVRWIMDNSEVLCLRPPGYHRANFKVFPYYIPYIIREDIIWILAFAHSRRKPQYWIGRSDS